MRLLFLLALLVPCVYSLSVIIPEKTVDCYYEELEKGEKMTISYQVSDGANLEIDFFIKNPRGDTLLNTVKTTANSHSFSADHAGRYIYCFSNDSPSSTEKRVTFNIHENIQKIQDSLKEHTDPLEREIAELAESIFAVKAEQEYIVVRERQHRDTAESTNSRVKWWSIAQLALLVSVCFWQVYYLKRFFEVKRAV
ncbi:COPII-coated vesicle protein [Pilobolus umbonatus]|nr:COPII-coated vesicle protein [Pilobolus umbonatus]